MKLQIPLHTILLTVAPTNAGKSFFCENILLPQLKDKYPKLNVQYISSDSIRRDLLGDEATHKHDSEMMQVSDQAFKLLNLKLESVMSFPIASEVIVVDTTGLAESFRNDILALGNKNNYNVIPIIFDYTDRNDYYSMKDDKVSNSVISIHVQKLKKEVLKTINKTKYKDVFRIKEKSFNDVEVEIINYDFYRSHFIEDETKEYVVVSDIHGCLDEFKDLINVNGSLILEDDYIVGDKVYIVQDYVDKGYDICQTINFIHKNFKNGTIIPLLGNHENYVYKRLKSIIKEDKELEEAYFNSVGLLLEDEETRNNFFELVEASKNFYRHKLFYVNHAPCNQKYLSKIDNYSLKNQRTFVYAKRKDFDNDSDYITKVEEQLSFVNDYKSWNSKPVVWGHISIGKSVRVGNTNFIDTGCVSGGKLTSVAFDKINGTPHFKSVSAKSNPRIVHKELVNLFDTTKNRDISLESLEINDIKRIKHLIKNKVNYISGTMSPADKNLDDNELESLKEGLNYYKNAGIDKVILQKKYMGSNITVYLFEDIDKCYATSRNGYLINKVDLKETYQRMFKKFKKYFLGNDIKCLVLSGELMPWSAMAKGLIEDSYIPIQIGTKTEYELMVNNGFYNEIEKILNNPNLPDFKVDIKSMKKSDLVEKYGQNNYRTLSGSVDYEKEYMSMSEYQSGMNTFKEQIEIFGTDGEIDIKLFSLLKEIYLNGTENVLVNNDESNIDLFEFVSEDDCWIVDFKEDSYLENAQEFFKKITLNEKLEGIVIKPNKVYNVGVAPYLKVRSPKYLTLTYSFDYKKENKYNKLLTKKSIRNKVKSSIKEFELGKQMLEVPYDEINDDNKKLISIYAKMILDEKFVETLDPRL